MSLDFLKNLFVDSSGNIDWFLIAAGVVALAYAVMLLLMPFAIWKIRSESIRARRASQSSQAYIRECRELLRNIYDQSSEATSALRRTSRPSLTSAHKNGETSETKADEN